MKAALRTLMPQARRLLKAYLLMIAGAALLPAHRPSLSAREREQWAGRIALRPEDFAAGLFPLSHAKLAGRPFVATRSPRGRRWCACLPFQRPGSLA